MASERKIIEALRRRSPVAVPGLKLGIGDDCAIYSPQPGEDLVFTTDFLIENVHFRLETHRAQDIGFKCLARGLSDLAAMGATPRFCLLSLAFPPETKALFVQGVFDGLGKLATRERCPLVGGDLASAALLVCDIVACGSVRRGKSLRRDGASAGDGIWVSGMLGGSALGLKALKGAAFRKHLRPEPRLALGRFLHGKASAAMDLSDGLSLDLFRLCRESGVSAEIESPPLFKGATLEQALHGGEDYELLFTVPAKVDLPASFEEVPLTRIGRIVGGTPGRVRLNGKRLRPGGFDHFAGTRLDQPS